MASLVSITWRSGHRQRQVDTPILSVGPPFRPPFYGPLPDDVTAASIDESTSSPDSTATVTVDPLLPPISTTSACSVIRITEYITVYGTPSSTSSPGNFTSAPYGWNSSVTSSWLLTGTSVTTTTSRPYFPISNSTTSTAPFGTDGTGSPTFVNLTSSAPTTSVLVPTNFTSFPNISTPDVTPTPIPTSSVVIPGNFTTFANITSTPEISILPIPTSSFANVSSVSASTTAEEPTSSDGPTVTSIIIPPTETTVIVPGQSSTVTITSLVIDPTETPIEVATSTATSTSPTLVIVTTLTPIATASSTPSEFPTTVVTATDTVSSNAPTGTPSPQTIHCGIRGTAIGVFYLATYAYNRANVPVTLQGCYQFCSIAVEQCYSYEFYLEPGLGSPRCKLYGGLVAYEVSSIDPYQPYQWFDVACGDPTKFGT
ncbi:hypothetical protein LA080_005015 [Diaporthe eres]|nr:hypothetical protein LA080_005015 [Diaporthe eres]